VKQYKQYYVYILASKRNGTLIYWSNK